MRSAQLMQILPENICPLDLRSPHSSHNAKNLRFFISLRRMIRVDVLDKGSVDARAQEMRGSCGMRPVNYSNLNNYLLLGAFELWSYLERVRGHFSPLSQLTNKFSRRRRRLRRMVRNDRLLDFHGFQSILDWDKEVNSLRRSVYLHLIRQSRPLRLTH